MGKGISKESAGPVLRALGLWFLLFGLGAALIVTPLAGGKQNLILKGADVGSSQGGSTGIWDEVDDEIGLVGLWGSIDPDNDIDPFIYTVPSTGDVHLFWAKWNGDFYEVAHAHRPLGSVWGAAELVEAVPLNSKNNVTPRAVVDSLGLLHVAWTRAGGFTSSVYHAVRVSGGWTAPDLLSDFDIAWEPFPWLDGDCTMVDYQTAMELVTVEILVDIAGYSGGSDDIDPSQVTVDSETVNRQFAPQ